ncbi:MAG: large repetitive protein, partial [Humisphaera sp.]|nr:large repetitive protein [Humisphaera sp.]
MRRSISRRRGPSVRSKWNTSLLPPLMRVGVESLESRVLLAAFYPSPATPDGAPYSLRQAVMTSNTNGQNDTINLKAGTYELTLQNLLGQENFAATGDLDLKEATRTVTFKGAGVKKTFIDANQWDRVFQVDPNVTVIFKDLTITG